MRLTEQEILRYSRHIILSEVGGRGQLRLKTASVLLAGLGPSGSAAALYLAAAGVGHLTLWDPSVVTAQDLEGAIAHDTTRIGLPRARSAAVPIQAINPDAVVEVLDRESDVLGAVPAHQVVLASNGDWGALVGAAVASGASAVVCGAHGASGAVASFKQGEPAWSDLETGRAHTIGLYPEEGSLPALSAAAGVIGVIAATEVVKLILGIGDPLFGRVLCYDGWAATFREERFPAAAEAVR